ncbi:hypothetical protein ANMWB30_24030 [Arthrobacter sp. MWB30]|nr:hypothetical protein ANMWB30_24030 [Arthrobacter sp. MWB30]
MPVMSVVLYFAVWLSKWFTTLWRFQSFLVGSRTVHPRNE